MELVPSPQLSALGFEIRRHIIHNTSDASSLRAWGLVSKRHLEPAATQLYSEVVITEGSDAILYMNQLVSLVSATCCRSRVAVC